MLWNKYFCQSDRVMALSRPYWKTLSIFSHYYRSVASQLCYTILKHHWTAQTMMEYAATMKLLNVTVLKNFGSSLKYSMCSRNANRPRFPFWSPHKPHNALQELCHRDITVRINLVRNCITRSHLVIVTLSQRRTEWAHTTAFACKHFYLQRHI